MTAYPMDPSQDAEILIDVAFRTKPPPKKGVMNFRGEKSGTHFGT